MADVSDLLRAAYSRDWDAVAHILETRPVASLAEAATVGDVAAVRAHLADDPTLVAQRTGDGFTPLHLATYFRRPAVVAVLLEHGADVHAVAENPTRLRPLHSAVAARDVDSVRMLLERGAEPDARQQGGHTALMGAAHHGDEALVELLLQHGADPSLRSDEGRTAGDLAGGRVPQLRHDR